jgi:uncharacterized protein (UPF0276 family)
LALPRAAGIGLRTAHLARFAGLEGEAPPAAWLEIHSETFLCDGGPRLAMLDGVAATFPLSCHGVGLSLASFEGLSKNHLARLKRLFDRVRPASISEHLAWSVNEGIYLNDLMPLPYTQETLAVVCDNISRAQDFFGRQILLENPSAYMTFAESTMREPAFLALAAQRTGCGLLLDINNVYVSAANCGFNATDYLRQFPDDAVGEIHLAGHSPAGSLLIDTHDTHVCADVWTLFESVVARIGPRPILIEWDAVVPNVSTLFAEAEQADAIQRRVCERHAYVA